jgi:hypothetical protein
LRVFACFVLFACTTVHAADMLDLRYQDSEGEGVSYPTRILVTDRYLRMDEGSDDGDFVLLDRKNGKVVNVQHERKMLMAIHEGKAPKAPPHAYKVEERVTPIREGTVRVEVLADGKLCSETVAAAKLFPDAARALREYNAALAYTQWTTYRNTPVELRQDCDLVHHVWQADLALSRGLPLEERDYAGRVRRYVSGEKRTLKPELFKLPEGYEIFQLPGFEGDAAGSNSQPSAEQAR